MSPITANRTEPSFRGRVSVRVTGAWAAEAAPEGAGGAGQRASQRTTTRRLIVAWLKGVT